MGAMYYDIVIETIDEECKFFRCEGYYANLNV